MGDARRRSRLSPDEVFAERAASATFLAVALGVAFMSGVLVLADTMNSTFDDLFGDIYKDTDAVVRVLIDSTDGELAWTTIGVSTNIIEASWQALTDALVWGLLHSGQ